MIAGADAPPAAHVFGAMLAGAAEAEAQLAQLAGLVGAEPASVSLHELSYRAAKRHLAEHGPGEEPAAPSHFYSRSEFFQRPLPAGAAAALVEHLGAGRPSGQVRTLDFTPWGGAYNRVAAATTAFPHRAERFLLEPRVRQLPRPGARGLGRGLPRRELPRACCASRPRTTRTACSRSPSRSRPEPRIGFDAWPDADWKGSNGSWG